MNLRQFDLLGITRARGSAGADRGDGDSVEIDG